MKDKEINKWTMPSNIEKHYHIHYVDNTKQKYTRVCMPMCSDRHIHTISQIIQYLKRLYGIEEEECIYPYRRNSSGYWKYIQEEERDKTVHEFAEYDIVFYYIEEGLRENYFTFAEFESHIQPKGETVRIPLFLSPLMRSAVSMGPFKEQDKINHVVILSIKSMLIRPNVYVYKKKYKKLQYFYIYYYYSNLYIQRDNIDIETIDCYIVDSKANINNNIVTVEWYVKVPNSVDEYTHCILSDELINNQGKYDKFSKSAKSREYTPDGALYGFSLQSSLEKTDGLNDIDCSTNDPIDPNNISDCKLSIVPIRMIFANPKIANLQSKIDELDREIKHINMKIKEPGITEEQKKELRKKRKNSNWTKCRSIRKINKMQPEKQLLIKEEPSATPFPPSVFFIVFRCSNTQTKSSLGAHNEILDALTRRYNQNQY